jgi:1-phosphofructokinase
VPKNCDENIYSSLLEIAAKKGIKSVVDAEGKLLLNCLKYKPFLIKPNTAELEGIFETRISGEEDIIKYAAKLHQMGAQNVVVSCGKMGAVLVCEQGVFKAASPKGNAVNAVGAGDSLVAGFIAAACENASPQEALMLGVAAGSATAFSENLARKQEILDLSSKISIIKL